MLEPRRRTVFVVLVVLLFISGSMELVGMVVLFSFVRGLNVDAETLQRSGPLGRGLERLTGGPVSQLDFVIWGGSFVVAFMVFKNLQGTTARFALNKFLMKLNQRISAKLYRSYMLAAYESMKKLGVNSQAKNVQDTFDLYNKCFSATVQVLADGSIVVMIVGLLLYVDIKMTLFAIAIFGGVAACLHILLQRRLAQIGELSRKAKGEVNQFLREGLEGVIDIRLRGSREYFLAEYRRALGLNSVMNRRQFALSRLPRSANEVALSGMIVGATLLVTLQGQSVAEALPQLSVFGFAGLRIVGVMGRLNSSAQVLRRLIKGFTKSQNQLAKMVPEVVGLPPRKRTDYLSEEQPLPAGKSARLTDRITLSQVAFRYPGAKKRALSNISFEVPRGANIGICGPSGGGKSTLLLVLMGLFKPTKGKVCCDDWSVHQHIQPWHRNIGYVGQAPFLVDRTIRENVAFGLPPEQIDDTKVSHAISLAAADEFVRALPKGLDTVVGESGSSLSGGQRQRLVIARALYEDPDILILDEATAALDNATEREITESIATLRGRKTIISVAHRLSSIEGCDVLYFLSKGELVAQGTYSELLQSCPEFRQMAHGSALAEAEPQ